jgi:hypothetical protein
MLVFFRRKRRKKRKPAGAQFKVFSTSNAIKPEANTQISQ